MMKVRTLRKHFNAYGNSHTKNPGKQYDVPDGEAQALIDAKLVEAVDGGTEEEGE